MKNTHIKAVHDDDLITLLNSLGVYDSLIRGERHCAYCDEIITLENLGSICPLEDTICFSCNKEICLQKLLETGDNQ